MKEMNQSGGGGGMFGMGNMPDMYLVVNTNSPLATTILIRQSHQEHLVKQALDLAKLSQNLLRRRSINCFCKEVSK
jgi:molecular chaperone HtpG